jgi:hypothetical protein
MTVLDFQHSTTILQQDALQAILEGQEKMMDMLRKCLYKRIGTSRPHLISVPRYLTIGVHETRLNNISEAGVHGLKSH